MLDEWDPETYTPLVAVVPVGVEDTELEEVVAFDVSGQRHWIDADTYPEFPVIVVALNERTDEAGNLRQEYATPVAGFIPPAPCDWEAGDECDDGGSGGGGGTGGGTSSRAAPHTETLEWVRVINDREPFLIEPAEINYKVVCSISPLTIYSREIGDPEPEDMVRYLNIFQFSWTPGMHGAFCTYEWWEDDWEFEADNNNDPMGTATVTFTDPLSTTYGTSDIEWNMK